MSSWANLSQEDLDYLENFDLDSSLINTIAANNCTNDTSTNSTPGHLFCNLGFFQLEIKKFQVGISRYFGQKWISISFLFITT